MSGQVINIPASSGGGGTPGGANTSIQFNNSGAFGGFGTWDGTTFDVTGDLNASTISCQLVNVPTIDNGFGIIEMDNNRIRDNGNALVIDWQNKQLLSPLGFVTVDWLSGNLITPTNDVSIDWGDYQLKKTGYTILDWSSGVMNNTSGNLCIDIFNNTLSNGGTTYLSWSGGIGFFGTAPVPRQSSSGAVSAGGFYGGTEQTMLQQAYDALRAYGLMT